MLREKEGSFTSRRVQVENGLGQVSNRTVHREMNEEDYKYLWSCKKEILSKNYIAKRVRYCRDKIKQKSVLELRFYFNMDSTRFNYKANPMYQAFAPKLKK